MKTNNKKMKVYIEKDDKTLDIKLDKPMVLKELLKELDTSVESVIVQKNGSICLEDATVNDTDELRILSVVSGG